jgi:hypothetical protein
VPPDLERVVRRLLEKAPNDRFDSAAEVCAALDAIERSMIDGKTEAMSVVGSGRFEFPSRAEILDEQDYSLNLDWPAGAPRRRHKLAALGVLLFSAGAVVYALVDRAGMMGVGQLEAPAAAAAAASTLDPQAAVEPERPAPQPAPVVEPLAPKVADVEPSEPDVKVEAQAEVKAEAKADAPRVAARSSQARRRAAAEIAEERAEDRAARSPEAYVEPDEPELDEEEETISTPEPAFTPSPAPEQPQLTAEAPVVEAPAAPTRVAPTRPPVRRDPPVDQLVREYREVGEAIARLEASRGERAVRGLRDRYFRLPYADALRIPAVRRDTMAALASLRRAVTATEQRISADSSSVPAG